MPSTGEEGSGVPEPGVFDELKEGVPGIGEPEPVGCPPVVVGEDKTAVCSAPGVWIDIEVVSDATISEG